MLCGNCDRYMVAVLPRGKAYQVCCFRCCKHTKGVWELTEDYHGYRWGFRTYVCMEGCGKILKEEQLLG